jgi:hypothetical protein
VLPEIRDSLRAAKYRRCDWYKIEKEREKTEKR